MIIVNAPLKQEMFQKYAEDEGLVFIKKSGMKLFFENPEGEDGKKADALKKKLKGGEGTGSYLFFSSGPVRGVYENRTSFISVIRYK